MTACRPPACVLAIPELLRSWPPRLGFCHLFAGFTNNQQLVQLVSTLLDALYLPPSDL